MRVGLVLEGGALRGLYSAGVMDELMKAGIEVNDIVAVSAGALFGVNYVSKQIGRAWRYNQRFLHDKRYMSIRSWLTTGNLVNKDFTYYQVPFELDPFDDATFKQSPTRFHVPVTHVKSGQVEYVEIESVLAQMEIFRATSALPFVSKMVTLPTGNGLTGGQYLDGGIVDSIPVSYAQQLGVDKLIIILTRPQDYRKKPSATWPYRLTYPRHPHLATAMGLRHTRYNDSIAKINQLEAAGDAFVFRPSQAIPVRRFENNLATLAQLYQLGIADAQQALPQLQHYLQKEHISHG